MKWNDLVWIIGQINIYLNFMTMKKTTKLSKAPEVADFVYEEPYDLRNRFNNLKDPLKFIESEQIKKL